MNFTNMKVTARLKNLRISPRKTRLATDLVKGRDVEDALVILNHTVKKTSVPLEKLLRSAIANAENNFGLDKDNIYIYDIQVGEGTTLKRWLPRAYGRATKLLKRSSNIYLVLEERIEGKNRKSKEQLRKEREAAKAATKKMEKETERQEQERQKKLTREEAPKAKKDIKDVYKKKQEESRSEWVKKIFRRKSV